MASGNGICTSVCRDTPLSFVLSILETVRKMVVLNSRFQRWSLDLGAALVCVSGEWLFKEVLARHSVGQMKVQAFPPGLFIFRNNDRDLTIYE